MLSPLASLVAPVAPITIGGVELVPLLARRPVALPPFDLLDDALASGRATITEVGEGGIVGEVLVRHDGDAPLLILDGEEIVGAKQNRTFNGSFLVACGTVVKLPVSCVERGRWHHQGVRFGSSERTVSPTVRGTKVRGTAQTLSTSGTYAGDQGAVWDRVREYSAQSQVSSGTESLAEVMATRVSANKAAVDALPILPAQIGLAAIAGGRLLGADIVGSPELYARVHKKIARGFTAEICEGSGGRDAVAVVSDALAALSAAHDHGLYACGSGTTIVTQTPSCVATALLDGDHLLHSVIVPAE